MRTETLHPVTDYVQELVNFLTGAEGFRGGLPYFDAATPHPRATIGFGFNIEIPDYLLLVLRQMGIINSAMTIDLVNRIRDAFTTAINNTPHTGDLVLQTNLNRIAAQYAGTTRFQLTNRTQGENIIREIIVGLTIGCTDGNIVVQGKQERLDALLKDPITQQDTLAHDSKEYVAVMSLFYNLEILINSKDKLLANAIINDNRAEAWYEIRYNSNLKGIHADRRYKEADLFGLYDGGTLTADQQTAQAKEIMRMFTRYEVENLSGTRLSEYELAYPPPTNTKYIYGTIPANIKYISDTIKPASDLLVAQFALGKPIDGLVLVGKGLDSYNYIEKGNWSDKSLEGDYYNDLIFGEKGNDKLSGFNGNDVIYGGEGKDTLIGGIGNDTLIGGAGEDTYIFRFGDGNDTFIDSDGTIPTERSNLIYEDALGHKHDLSTLYGSGVGLCFTADGLITYSNGVFTLPGGGTITLQLAGGTNPLAMSQNALSSSDPLLDAFGINLITLPANPGIENTITGTDQGWRDDPGDDFYDTGANDEIFALGGDDYVLCDVGGANWISGGDGYDNIDAENSSSSIIEGGAGSNIIIGGVNGNNQLFGDSRGGDGDLSTVMATHIANGETAADSGTRVTSRDPDFLLIKVLSSVSLTQ